MTFFELAEKVLEKCKRPLTPSEIWNKAKEYKYDDAIQTKGKTPHLTIGARIYVDIKNNPKSVFIQVSNRPATFSLKRIKEIDSEEENQDDNKEKDSEESSFTERDLHPLLTSFVFSNPYFKCYTKTIYHEKSKKGVKGESNWVHPDIVGVHFSFQDLEDKTASLFKFSSESQFELFSFEMKIKITNSNLRECFFQAVSNSSWANEGYLVALEYENEVDIREKMQTLNEAFGIGFIKLNPDDIPGSEILFPAKKKRNLDWNLIDDLAEINPDFLAFISAVVSDIKGERINKTDYDKIYNVEPGKGSIYEYIENKKIKTQSH